MNEEIKVRKEQNALIAELVGEVQSLNVNNTYLVEELNQKIDRTVAYLDRVTEAERTFKEEMVNEVKHEVGLVCTQVKSQAKEGIEQAIADAKRKMQNLCEGTEKKLYTLEKRVDGVCEKLRIRTGIQKFFFWATPVIMLVQTVALIIALG